MSLLGFVGVLGALGFVLVLLGAAFAAIRKFTGLSGGAGQRLPMEVVQRLPLGPKQGIAVVRIGERVLAVSMGEGGIRHLIDLDDADRQVVMETTATESATPRLPTTALGKNGRRSLTLPGLARPVTVPKRKDFAAALRTALRTYVALTAIATGALLAAGHFDAIAAQQVLPETGISSTLEPNAPDDAIARADSMITRLAPTIDLAIGNDQEGGLRLSGTVGVVVMMGLLTLLPTLLLMMTSFTRILIVLHFLRQALGTQSAPPAHLMAALALLLTGFVMAPTFSEVNQTALQPWMNGEIEQAEMLSTGVVPFREFMLDQTREQDIATFLEMRDETTISSVDDIPLSVVVSAFVTSELKTAFQIGFALFLPFIVIDVVVAAVLMSMGMFMLPPAMISLPFKLLLFVLVDGWSLIVQGLVTSFN